MLKIGPYELLRPVFHGGMGIGVSMSGLASAVSNAGGLGVVSGIGLGFRELDWEKNFLDANIRCLKSEVFKAKEKAGKNPIGVNLMVAISGYEEHVRAAVEAGADFIISGAGLPTMLPKYVDDPEVGLIPIVSSGRTANIIIKSWERHYQRYPAAVVLEGPKAGGHLGYKKNEIYDAGKQVEILIEDVLNVLKSWEEKAGRKIPLIVGGGVRTYQDTERLMGLGADGVQIGTPLIVSQECDASDAFKNMYIQAKDEDIIIIDSPVGMPGRALLTPFTKRSIEEQRIPITRCNNCLVPCVPKTTPYCISEALVLATEGDRERGLFFSGENVSDLKAIEPVARILDRIVPIS